MHVTISELITTIYRSPSLSIRFYYALALQDDDGNHRRIEDVIVNPM